jgi:hypothetical protein
MGVLGPQAANNIAPPPSRAANTRETVILDACEDCGGRNIGVVAALNEHICMLLRHQTQQSMISRCLAALLDFARFASRCLWGRDLADPPRDIKKASI